MKYLNLKILMMSMALNKLLQDDEKDDQLNVQQKPMNLLSILKTVIMKSQQRNKAKNANTRKMLLRLFK